METEKIEAAHGKIHTHKHVHRHHHNRPWYKRLQKNWQALPLRRRKMFTKIIVGIIVSVLAVLSAIAVVGIM